MHFITVVTNGLHNSKFGMYIAELKTSFLEPITVLRDGIETYRLL